CRSIAGSGAADRRRRGEPLAFPTAEPRRTDPPSHGSTRPVSRRYGPVGHAEPRERGAQRQEGPQPDDGAPATGAILRSGGLAVVRTRNDKKPRRRARRGVSARLPAFLRPPAF